MKPTIVFPSLDRLRAAVRLPERVIREIAQNTAEALGADFCFDEPIPATTYRRIFREVDRDLRPVAPAVKLDFILLNFPCAECGAEIVARYPAYGHMHAIGGFIVRGVACQCGATHTVELLDVSARALREVSEGRRV